MFEWKLVQNACEQMKQIILFSVNILYGIFESYVFVVSFLSYFTAWHAYGADQGENSVGFVFQRGHNRKIDGHDSGE